MPARRLPFLWRHRHVHNDDDDLRKRSGGANRNVPDNNHSNDLLQFAKLRHVCSQLRLYVESSHFFLRDLQLEFVRVTDGAQR